MKSFPEVFELLMDAILEKESVEIEYQKSAYHNEEYSIRKISPTRFVLVERRKSYFHRLCVEAHCHLRKDIRVFAVYRIKELKKL